MNPADVELSLHAIESALRPHLNGNEANVLAPARAELRATRQHFEWAQRQTPAVPAKWGFTIPAATPLTFDTVDIDGHRLRFDLYGHEWWSIDEGQPQDLLVVCRVWAMDLNDMFRPEWDRDELFEQLDEGRGRVLVRFHYDKAHPRQQGPEYHVQFGGITTESELCWLHPDISVPRVVSHPVDFTLAAELVVATLHGVKDRVFRDPTFRGAIRVSQQTLLTDYFQRASAALIDDARVLERLWNPGVDD